MDSANQTNCCVIDALCGIDSSSPHIAQFTDSFNCIKFLLKKNMEEYTFMIITDIDGHVQLITTDGDNLIKEKDENSNTVLLWNIGKEITASSGALVYQIAAYHTDGGETKSVWYSKEGRLFVSESIDSTPFSTNLIGSEPNLITRLILSCEGLTSSVEKNTQKLSDIEEGANANVQSDWSETNEASDAFIKNKPEIDTVLSPESDNAISNSAVCTKFDAVCNELNTVTKDIESAKESFEKGAILIEGTAADLISHRLNEFENENHLTNEEKMNVGKIAEIEETANNAWTDVCTLVDEEVPNIYAGIRENENRLNIINSPVITEIPSSLEPNRAYNFGSVGTASTPGLTLSFPRVAEEGDVIYIGFICQYELNLVVDTSNTFDFELIPEADTGYEIYAKCTTNTGVVMWIVKYSEYTGV